MRSILHLMHGPVLVMFEFRKLLLVECSINLQRIEQHLVLVIHCFNLPDQWNLVYNKTSGCLDLKNSMRS